MAAVAASRGTNRSNFLIAVRHPITRVPGKKWLRSGPPARHFMTAEHHCHQRSDECGRRLGSGNWREAGIQHPGEVVYIISVAHESIRAAAYGSIHVVRSRCKNRRSGAKGKWHGKNNVSLRVEQVAAVGAKWSKGRHVKLDHGLLRQFEAQ